MQRILCAGLLNLFGLTCMLPALVPAAAGQDLIAPAPTGGQAPADDTFGWCPVGVGDLNGDGVPDFAVGDWSHSGKQDSEGWVGVISGAGPELIWEALGGAVDSHLGRWLGPLPDLDGDGIEEVAASADNEFVHVLSGADGSTLARMEGRRMAGIPSVSGGTGPDLALTKGQFQGSLEGDSKARTYALEFRSGRDFSLLAVGPDGAPWSSPELGGWCSASGHAFVMTAGAELHVVPPGEGARPMRWRTDFIQLDWAWRPDQGQQAVIYHRGNTVLALGLLDEQGQVAVQTRLGELTHAVNDSSTVQAIGDLNGDGVSDLLVGYDGSDTWNKLQAGVYCGRKLDLQWSARPSGEPPVRNLAIRAAGDMDRDGVRDVLIGVHWATGGPRVAGRVEVRSGATGRELFRVLRADL